MDTRAEAETEYGERTRNQSTEDESSIGKFFELIPLDLTYDILLRLPAKSAVSLRVVSKLWSSITTRPDFIRSFAIQSSTRLSLLICLKAGDKRLFITLPQHELPVDASYSNVDRTCQIKAPEVDKGYSYDPCSIESVNGLVCFGDFSRIVVMNPSMRQHVTLPEPKPRVKYFARSCLGHDPVEDKYKVLCLSGRHNGHYDPLVFTLGPQESWRVAQNSPPHIPLPTMKRLGMCINGHVYYEAEMRFTVDDSNELGQVLMNFDVRYEKFNTIKKPADPTLCSNFMLNYQGKLAWVCSDFRLRFWVLVDGDKHEWSLKDFLLPFPWYPQIDPISECRLRLRGVTHDTGEFIFTATRFGAFYVLYYDLKTKRARRIEYEGMIQNENLENNCCEIDWFPNHNESLMSLDNVLCLEAD